MRKSRSVKHGCRVDYVHPIPKLRKCNKNIAVKRQCSNVNFASFQPRKGAVLQHIKKNASILLDHSGWETCFQERRTEQISTQNTLPFKWHRLVELTSFECFLANIYAAWGSKFLDQ